MMRLARIGEQSAKRTQEALVSDLVAIAYPNLETAREVAQNVGQAQKAHLIELDDMVIAEHRNDGKLKLHQPSLAGVGAAGGALWGGLIGLIFFAPLFGMAIGAASGAAGRQDDRRRRGRQLHEGPGAKLEPGKAALILLSARPTPTRSSKRSRSRARSSRPRCRARPKQALKDALEKAGSAA